MIARLITWRPLLTVVTLIALEPTSGPSTHTADTAAAGAAGEVPADRPEQPRPPRRCRGPPPGATEPHRPDGHTPPTEGHCPIHPNPVPPAHNTSTTTINPAVRSRLHPPPAPMY